VDSEELGGAGHAAAGFRHGALCEAALVAGEETEEPIALGPVGVEAAGADLGVAVG
jgi:hypothetical protein